MPWVKMSDDYYDNPKLAAAGPLAELLWARSIAWSNRNQQDGKVPRATARSLGAFAEDFGSTWQTLTAALERANLWHVSDDGWEIHDYLDYQRSSAQIRELTEARSKAGKKGAEGRWGSEEGVAPADPVEESVDLATDCQPDSNGHGKPHGLAIAESPSQSQSPSAAQPPTVLAAKAAKKRGTQAPDSFDVTADLAAWASKKGVRFDLAAETETFLDWHRAKGSVMRDWDAAWRTWITKAQEFKSRPGGPSRPTPHQRTQQAISNVAAQIGVDRGR